MEDNTLSGQQTWRRILKQKSVEIEIPGIRLPNLNHGLFEYETNDPILTISQSSDILEIPEEECEKINLMTDLIQLGFRLSKKSLKIPGIKRPEIYYAIVRYQKGDELEIKARIIPILLSSYDDISLTEIKSIQEILKKLGIKIPGQI